jgi:hypothetical protein
MEGTANRETILLGGRLFVPLDRTTVEHDHWYMRHVRAAGLDSARKRDDESPDDFARRLLGLVLDSGRATLLLAGLIVPTEGAVIRWTPAGAAETAEFLARLEDPVDKRQVSALLAGMLADFFVNGLISWGDSLPSSDGQPGPMSLTAPGVSGRTSSAPSPDSTRSARSLSLAGPWWRRCWPFARRGGAKRQSTSATAASFGR